MNLYLSSYKLGNRKDVLKKWRNYNDNKILLIPNALDSYKSDEKQKQISEIIKELKELSFDVTILDLKNYFNNYPKLIQDLNGFRNFCVMGGNVFVLRKAMQLSKFDNYLTEKANNNQYLYIGYSAGICVLGNTLKGLELVCEPINPYNQDKITFDGLGLIDYSIAPHYKSNHKSSKLIDKVVQNFNENNLNYRTLKDGEVIISKCHYKKHTNNDERDLC